VENFLCQEQAKIKYNKKEMTERIEKERKNNNKEEKRKSVILIGKCCLMAIGN
jgi:hypothetical protein